MKNNKLPIKVISFFLSLLFVIGCSGQSVFAENKNNPNDLPSPVDNTPAEVAFGTETNQEIAKKLADGEDFFELETKREENVKHFRLSDGSYQAVVYNHPIHRKNAENEWEIINNDLTVKNGKYVTSDQRFSFTQDFTRTNELFSMNDGEYEIVFEKSNNLQFSLVQKVAIEKATSEDVLLDHYKKDSDKIVYTDSQNGVEYEYVLYDNDVKESIIVRTQTDTYNYSFVIKTKGLNAIIEDNQVFFYDQNTLEKKYYIPAPFMFDAAENYSKQVEYDLVDIEPGTMLLSVSADANWINSNDRVLPVTIDPTLYALGQSGDAYIIQYDNDNYGKEKILWVADHLQTYIKFDKPHLPSGVSITSSSLSIPYYYYSDNDPGMNVDVYKVTSSWSEYGINWSNKPTIDSICLDTKFLSTSGATSSSPGVESFNVTGCVTSWYSSGATNNGFAVLRQANGSVNTSVILLARENRTISSNLTITYTGTHLPEGVYVARKKDSNLYIKTVINNSTSSAARIRQKYSSTIPNEADDRETLIKLSYRASNNDYVIRSMLDNQRVFYLDLSTNQAPITWKRSESDSSLSSNFRWTITQSGGYYLISQTRSGTVYYLKSNSSTDGAALTYTTNANDSGIKWFFYSYQGNAYDNIDWDNFTSTLLPGDTFAFLAHMYSTRVGINGPIEYSVENIDGTTTDKAVINSNTGELQALDFGKVKVIAKFDNSPCEWSIVLTIPRAVTISCYNSLGYWDVSNSATSPDVECNELEDSERYIWFLEDQGSNYFAIRNYVTGYFLENNSNSLEHVELTGSITDSYLWSFILLDDGTYKIRSKSAPSYYITEQNVNHGWEDPDIILSNSDEGTRQKWQVFSHSFSATANNYFDKGYYVYYSETSSDSKETITSYLNKVSDRYYSIVGLDLTFSVNYYSSDIDSCKVNVSSANIDNLCVHSGIIHTNRDEVISSFSSTYSGSNTLTNIYWSCHKIKSIATSGVTNYNRSCSIGSSIILIDRYSSADRTIGSQGVLMHELNHQYGGHDHYHELANPSDLNSCKFKDICSECGTNPRPMTCIMYDSITNITNANIICDKCQQDIREHLAEHH